MTTYTYSIQNDFPNHAISSDRLTQEIIDSAIVIALDHIDTFGDECSIVFKSDLDIGNKTILDGLISIHSGQPLPSPIQTVSLNNAVTDDMRLRVAIEKSNTSSITIFTQNWCDKTTWYEKSVRVDNEIATDDGAHTVYSLAHDYIIDTGHGKITGENVLTDSDSFDYRVAVKVNDVDKTEQDPHYGTGGDFTVDYDLGKITFLSALQPSDEVKVTYHYASSGTFTVKPAAGKKLTIEMVEVQFSEDIEINDTVVFRIYGYVDVFAPQYTPVPYPSGTLIPIKVVTYKTIMDYINDAVRSYPKYPPIGGSSWRGIQTGLLIFDWDYLRGETLVSAAGIEIRVELEHDEPFGGTVATATFYCSSEDE